MRSEKVMSVESEIGELVADFVADLEQLVRETALAHARALLGDEGPARAAGNRAPRPAASKPASKPASAPTPPRPAPAREEPKVEASADIDPWMRPLRPGVLETFDIRKKRRRAPKRKVEPKRDPLPRQPPVRALRVDGVTIIPSDDVDEAKKAPPPAAEPAAEAAPAAAGAEPARKWVVVRRPARDKQDGSTEGNGELPSA